MCQQVNYEIDARVLAALRLARRKEVSPLGQEVLARIIENAGVAESQRLPLCQDCGITVVFLEIGQDVHIAGGDLARAVTEGVRRGYELGYLRKSVVVRPFSARINSGDNTPPVIHTEIVAGNHLKIAVLLKGAGSENMSRLVMLKPADGRQGVIDFAVRAVDEAGGSPCPPLIVGLGIGATSDGAMLLSKKTLLRPLGEPAADAETAALEKEVLSRINDLGIGPLGLGGTTTALAVHAEARPAHIASLPVAVNLQCHSARRGEVTL